MECHGNTSTKSPAISKLIAYYHEHKEVPWVKIYTLPDEILFSHKRHIKGKVECTACHGPVAEREATFAVAAAGRYLEAGYRATKQALTQAAATGAAP